MLQKEVKDYQNEQIEQVQIAFRVYDPNGEKTDKQGKKYFGYEEDFDEWIPLKSARLAPHHQHTDDSVENLTIAAQNANPAAKNNKADEVSK